MVQEVETIKNVSAKRVLGAISISLKLDNNHFMSIAGLRALRLLVNQIVSGYGIKNIKVPIQAYTSLSINYQTKDDPYMNMLSNSNQAMAAVIGKV